MTGSRHTRQLRDAAARRVLDELDGMPPVREPGDHDPALAAETDALRHLTEVLGEVPAAGWASIPAPRAGTSRRRLHTWRRRIALSPAAAAAAVAVCLGLGFGAGALSTGGSSSAPPATANGPAVALRPLAGTPGQALATAYMPGRGEMLLRVAHLPPSPPGTYYELWLMTDTRHLAPVAAFRVGGAGSAQLALRLPDDPRRYAYLDISRQRVGGGTAISPDSVLRGRIA